MLMEVQGWPIQLLLEGLRHALPGRQPVAQPFKLLDKLLWRQSVVRKHHRMSQELAPPCGEFLDPLLQGLDLIAPGRGEGSGPQLGADRREPRLL